MRVLYQSAVRRHSDGACAGTARPCSSNRPRGATERLLSAPTRGIRAYSPGWGRLRTLTVSASRFQIVGIPPFLNLAKEAVRDGLNSPLGPNLEKTGVSPGWGRNGVRAHLEMVTMFARRIPAESLRISATGGPGNTGRKFHARRSTSPTDTASASPGMNSTAVCDAQTPSNDMPFRHAFWLIAQMLSETGSDKTKGLELLDSSPFPIVRAGGLEPPRAYAHCHLKTARLPFRHARRQSISLHLDCEMNKSACRGLRSNVLALVDVLWAVGVAPRIRPRNGVYVCMGVIHNRQKRPYWGSCG